MFSVGVRCGVVDVGSNSLLLSVGEWNGANWQAIAESSEVTGLGEGTKTTGMMGETQMVKTLESLSRAFEKSRNAGVEAKAFGTMALRIARNSADFLARAGLQGTPVEVISGELEAELGLLSVLEDSELATEKVVTVIDVGGHSTEIATSHRTGEAWDTKFKKSFPVGTLSLRDSVLMMESPTGLDLLRCSKEIDDIFSFRYMPNQTGKVVALGATATNLVTLREQLTEWTPEKVHGAYLEFEEVSKFASSLSSLSESARAKLPGLEKGREKSIHIGALILERGLQAVHGLGCFVSVKGWRHAMMSRVAPRLL